MLNFCQPHKLGIILSCSPEVQTCTKRRFSLNVLYLFRQFIKNKIINKILSLIITTMNASVAINSKFIYQITKQIKLIQKHTFQFQTKKKCWCESVLNWFGCREFHLNHWIRHMFVAVYCSCLFIQLLFSSHFSFLLAFIWTAQ